MEVGEVDYGEAGGAGRSGLEETIEDTVARGANACYGGIVELGCVSERFDGDYFSKEALHQG